MFGLKKVAAAPIVLSVPTKPAARPIAAGSEPLGTYEALAKELGFLPAQLLEEQLKRFLAESRIQVYPYQEVDKYLATLAENEGKAWIWRPLREKDKPDYAYSGRANKEKGIDQFRGHGSYRDEWNYRPYDKAVPIHILRQVKKIQDKFGDQVKFFVSDYAVPDPDPFIMVTALDVDRVIFGVWDEPGFGA
jgi:hypothetical protein